MSNGKKDLTNSVVPYEDKNIQLVSVADLQELGRVLGRSTPKSQRRTRPGPSGVKLTYIPWALVAKRMNEVFGPAWSLEYIGEPKIQGGEVIVGVRIRTPLGVQEAYGGSRFMPNNPNASYADALGGAGSKALRRACARLGIGLDLYATDEEVRDEDPDVLEARNALKATIHHKRLTDRQALDHLQEMYDDELVFKTFGDAVLHVMNERNKDEVDAIWELVETL